MRAQMVHLDDSSRLIVKETLRRLTASRAAAGRLRLYVSGVALALGGLCFVGGILVLTLGVTGARVDARLAVGRTGGGNPIRLNHLRDSCLIYICDGASGISACDEHGVDFIAP